MRLKAPSLWEYQGPLSWMLFPLSMIYGLVVAIRKNLFQFGVLPSSKLPVPVIFVGNIRVGGTGKTPTVIALANALYWRGFTPGVISRGYLSNLEKGQTKEVLIQQNVKECGDEPLLIKQKLGAKIPVWIGADRYQAGMDLLKTHPECNVIISDDGLQHLKLKRHPARNGGNDIEIILRDDRGEGNGFLLPAGPLREYEERPRDMTFNLLIHPNQTVDEANRLIGLNHYVIACNMGDAYQFINPSVTSPLLEFVGKRVLSVAGIANPNKFFDPLKALGLELQTQSLGDHADYTHISFSDTYDVILITEKDAVKCTHLNDPRIWVVPLEAHLPKECLDWVSEVLHRT
jgi:tetraacyldisaccharide 4'-kinase